MLNKETKIFMGVLACMMLLVGWHESNKAKAEEKHFTENYLTQLEEDAEAFADYFGIKYLTDEVKGNLVRLLNEINAHSKRMNDNAEVMNYQADTASDVMDYMSENLDRLAEDFYDKNGDGSNMSEEAYDKAWADTVIDHCHNQLEKAEVLATDDCHDDDTTKHHHNHSTNHHHENTHHTHHAY